MAWVAGALLRPVLEDATVSLLRQSPARPSGHAGSSKVVAA